MSRLSSGAMHFTTSAMWCLLFVWSCHARAQTSDELGPLIAKIHSDLLPLAEPLDSLAAFELESVQWVPKDSEVALVLFKYVGQAHTQYCKAVYFADGFTHLRRSADDMIKPGSPKHKYRKVKLDPCFTKLIRSIADSGYVDMQTAKATIEHDHSQQITVSVSDGAYYSFLVIVGGSARIFSCQTPFGPSVAGGDKEYRRRFGDLVKLFSAYFDGTISRRCSQ